MFFDDVPDLLFSFNFVSKNLIVSFYPDLPNRKPWEDFPYLVKKLAGEWACVAIEQLWDQAVHFFVHLS